MNQKRRACAAFLLLLLVFQQAALAQVVQITTYTEGNGHLLVLTQDEQQALFFLGNDFKSNMLLPLIRSGEITAPKALFFTEPTPENLELAEVLCGLMPVEVIYAAGQVWAQNAKARAWSQRTDLELGTAGEHALTVWFEPGAYVRMEQGAAVFIASDEPMDGASADQTVVWLPTSGLSAATRLSTAENVPNHIVATQEEHPLYAKLLADRAGFIVKSGNRAAFPLPPQALEGQDMQAAEASGALGPSEDEMNAAEAAYIGNSNSKKLHRPTCASLPAEKNQVLFETREAAVEKGYEPCKRCNP